MGTPAFGVEMIAVFTLAHLAVFWLWLLWRDSAFAGWATHVVNNSPAPVRTTARTAWLQRRSGRLCAVVHDFAERFGRPCVVFHDRWIQVSGGPRRMVKMIVHVGTTNEGSAIPIGQRLPSVSGHVVQR